jgi:hypothetical protein
MVAITGTDSLRQNQKTKVGFILGSTEDSITAHAGGTQAAARALTCQHNRLTTVATTADSVLLPPSDVGMEVTIANDGANAAQVFGAGTDTIDGVATATGVPLSATKRALFICLTKGKWISLMGIPSA